jgi:hypothetical protein
MPTSTFKPKNYFLNESHELSVEEKQGGGRQVEYLITITQPSMAGLLSTAPAYGA